jgi:hypothetical protein
MSLVFQPRVGPAWGAGDHTPPRRWCALRAKLVSTFADAHLGCFEILVSRSMSADAGVGLGEDATVIAAVRAAFGSLGYAV